MISNINITKVIILLIFILNVNSCTNDLPKKSSLFSSNDTNFRQYVYENPNDPQVVEMLKISRDNTSKLPDIIDFGVLELNEERKYTIYDVLVENGVIMVKLFDYETLDSISIAPAPEYTGNYNSYIDLFWEETDDNGKQKDCFKHLEINAIVVNKKTIKDEDNPIIEIWKAQNVRKIYRN